MPAIAAQVTSPLDEIALIYGDNFPLFATDCLKIFDRQKRLVPLSLNRAQREAMRRADEQKAMHGFVRMVVPKARRLGMSTFINARGFWLATQQGSAITVFVITHEDEATRTLFDMVKSFQSYLPPEFAHAKLRDSRRELLLANGSHYRVATAGTAEVGRSQTVQFFHGSEVALWPRQDRIALGAMQTVSLLPGTEIWLESTGNGATGLFYSYAMEASKGNDTYELLFLPWFWDDLAALRPWTGWEISREWADYAQTYDLSEAQLAWAWRKNAELIKGDDLSVGAPGTVEEPCGKFRQEYPATLLDCFSMQSFGKLISADAVARARKAIVPRDRNAAIVLGVDMSGGGQNGDLTTIVDRQGRTLGGNVKIKLRGQTDMAVVDILLQHRRRMPITRVYIDGTGGYGGGVVSRLVELGHGDWIVPVNFGAGSPDVRFLNMRAMMWWRLKEFIESVVQCSIPDEDEFASHLLAPKSRILESAGGYQRLEPKDETRKREKFSPDWGDAAALTFAELTLHDIAGAGEMAFGDRTNVVSLYPPPCGY